MTNVLVPIDGSPAATRAVAWVAKVLGAQANARVHLVHVQPPVDAWEVKSHLGSDDIARFQQEAAASVLTPATATLRASGLQVEAHSLVGDIASSIADRVTALGCDSVVMGTRGLGAVQGLLLGSTATKVIHLVDVPVTLIK